MSKGKKRDYSLPYGVGSITEQARLAKNGVVPTKPKKADKRLTEPVITYEAKFGKLKFPPGDGIITLPPGSYYYDESKNLPEDWYKKLPAWEDLSRLMGEMKPTEPVDTRTEAQKFTDEWLEKNS